MAAVSRLGWYERLSYSYIDHFWQLFVCNLFHGGFCYSFSRGLHRVAWGFQCGHLQLGGIVSDHVWFSLALLISIVGW